MKTKILDMATLANEPDDLLDDDLLSMFPRKRRSSIDQMVMVKSDDAYKLIRKDDIAAAIKYREDVIRSVMVTGYGFSVAFAVALMIARIVNPLVALPIIGTSLLLIAAATVHRK